MRGFLMGNGHRDWVWEESLRPWADLSEFEVFGDICSG